MSTRTPVACLRDRVGSTATIAGWVHRRRVLKSVAFLVVRDRSGTAQAVFAEPPDVAEETVVRLTGQVVANPQAPQGSSCGSRWWRCCPHRRSGRRSSCIGRR